MTVSTKIVGASIQVSWTSGPTNAVNRNDGHPFGGETSPMTDTNPPCNSIVFYSIHISGDTWDKSKPINSPKQCPTRHSTFLALIGLETPENPFGSFVLLVPFGERILQYLHVPGEITKKPWKRARSLKLMPDHVVLDSSLTVIQSSLKKLEMIACVVPSGQQEGLLLGSELLPEGSWSQPAILQADDGPLNQVTGSQGFIQSSIDGQEQFELLVPRANALFHYRHAVGSVSSEPWKHFTVLQLPGVEMKAQQFTFVSLRENILLNELEAIVSVAGKLFGYVLAKGNSWYGPFEIRSDQGPIEGVVGSPSFIQRNENTFDLVVSKGVELFHYALENASFQEGIWKLVAILNPPENNKRLHTVSLALAKNLVGHLELATRASDPTGQEEDFMVGYVYVPDANAWQHAVDLADENGHKIIARNDFQKSLDDDDAPTGEQPNPDSNLSDTEQPSSSDTEQPSIS